jgi:hypothetical protein
MGWTGRAHARRLRATATCGGYLGVLVGGQGSAQDQSGKWPSYTGFPAGVPALLEHKDPFKIGSQLSNQGIVLRH